jgi:hypothetical protein
LLSPLLLLPTLIFLLLLSPLALLPILFLLLLLSTLLLLSLLFLLLLLSALLLLPVLIFLLRATLLWLPLLLFLLFIFIRLLSMDGSSDPEKHEQNSCSDKPHESTSAIVFTGWSRSASAAALKTV